MISNDVIAQQALNYVRCGKPENPSVMLLHAVGTDLNMWANQIDALEAAYDVIAVDLPGHGLSKKLTGELTFERFSQSVSFLLDQLEINMVHVIGISFGSMVAQKLIIDRPYLVASLTLIGSAVTFSEPVRDVLKERAAFIRKNGMEAITPLSLERWFTPAYSSRRPDTLDHIKKLLLAQDKDYHAGVWDLIAGLDNVAALQSVRIQSMIIVGEEDTSTPLSSAEELAKALKTEKINVIPYAMHFANLESPDEVNKLIFDFLGVYIGIKI